MRARAAAVRTGCRSITSATTNSVNIYGNSTYGPPGRSSNSGVQATIFGAYGFLGRYVAEELGSRGGTGIFPFRGCEMEVRHLKVQFDLGNCGLIPFSPRDEDSIRQSVANSDVVVNLIGKRYDTKHLVPTRRADGKLSRVNFSLEETHRDIPATIARIAREEGVKRFVHVSAMMASPNSPARAMKAKHESEALVRAAFPDAIIVRPARMFGHQDRFLNWLAGLGAQMPFVPLIDGGSSLVQPVFVQDVANAIHTCMTSPDIVPGGTYVLPGPEEYSWREIAEFIWDVTRLQPRMVDIPKPLALRLAAVSEKVVLQGPVFTPDLVELMTMDEVEPTKAERDGYSLLDFSDLGITPTPMEKQAFNFLHRFRPGGHFAITQGYH